MVFNSITPFKRPNVWACCIFLINFKKKFRLPIFRVDFCFCLRQSLLQIIISVRRVELIFRSIYYEKLVVWKWLLNLNLLMSANFMLKSPIFGPWKCQHLQMHSLGRNAIQSTEVIPNDKCEFVVADFLLKGYILQWLPLKLLLKERESL